MRNQQTSLLFYAVMHSDTWELRYTGSQFSEILNRGFYYFTSSIKKCEGRDFHDMVSDM